MCDARRGAGTELKRIALEEYKHWDAECVLIEAKAGLPLTQELRCMGDYTKLLLGSGQDKFTRVNSVAPLLESGLV